jgi:galactonate dehydratase
MDHLRIREVEPILVNSGATKNWVFVKVQTDEGVSGWGEAYTFPDRHDAVRALVQELGRNIVGRDAGAIKPFTHFALRDFGGKRGSLELYSAISGIEQALWDILGKATDQPVYQLLGGEFRTRFRVYANGWNMDSNLSCLPIPEVVEAARELVTSGFTALKFDPFPGPWRAQIGTDDQRWAAQCVEAVREAVGPDVDLLIECHRRLTASIAIRMASIFEQYDPYWLEEPVVAEDVHGLRRVRESTSIPIVTGETLTGKSLMRDILAQRAVDIINPDVACCGGITELQEISSMADAYHVAVAPHNYNSTAVALASTLHASAVMPNFLITEYFVDSPTKDMVGDALRVVDGHIELPVKPGLGIELDEERMRANPPRQLPLRAFGDVGVPASAHGQAS